MTWLNVKQAAKYAGVDRHTITDWMADGLRHSRLGHRTVRIKKDWIDNYIERFEKTSLVDEALRRMT